MSHYPWRRVDLEQAIADAGAAGAIAHGAVIAGTVLWRLGDAIAGVARDVERAAELTTLAGHHLYTAAQHLYDRSEARRART